MNRFGEHPRNRARDVCPDCGRPTTLVLGQWHHTDSGKLKCNAEGRDGK